MAGLKLTVDASDAKRAASQFENSTRTIGRSARRAESKVDAMNRAFRGTKDKMASVARSIGPLQTVLGGLSVAGLGYMTNQALSATKQLEKLSEQTGFSTKSIQQLEFAATEAGVRTERLYDALGEMSQRMGEAASDGGEMARGFEEAGVAVDGLSQRDPQRVLYQVADAIENAKTESQALNIAVKTFGDEAGRDMVSMLREGSDGLRDMAGRARELGLVLDRDVVQQSAEAKEKVDLLVDVLGTQWQRVIGELAPKITEAADSMADWVSANQKFIKQDLPEHLGHLAEGLWDVASGIGWTLEKIGAGSRGVASMIYGPDTAVERTINKTGDLRAQLQSIQGATQ